MRAAFFGLTGSTGNRNERQLEAAVQILIPLTFRSNINERSVVCKPALTQAVFFAGLPEGLAIGRSTLDRIRLIRNEPGDIQLQTASGDGKKARYRPSTLRGAYQAPVLPIEAHGSCDCRFSPFCRISIEMPSGERTNAMWPSRGGRLIMTPLSIRCWQVA